MAKNNSRNSELNSSKHHISDPLDSKQGSMEIPPQKPKTTNQDNSNSSGKNKK